MEELDKVDPNYEKIVDYIENREISAVKSGHDYISQWDVNRQGKLGKAQVDLEQLKRGRLVIHDQDGNKFIDKDADPDLLRALVIPAPRLRKYMINKHVTPENQKHLLLDEPTTKTYGLLMRAAAPSSAKKTIKQSATIPYKNEIEKVYQDILAARGKQEAEELAQRQQKLAKDTAAAKEIGYYGFDKELFESAPYVITLPNGKLGQQFEQLGELEQYLSISTPGAIDVLLYHQLHLAEGDPGHPLYGLKSIQQLKNKSKIQDFDEIFTPGYAEDRRENGILDREELIESIKRTLETTGKLKMVGKVTRGAAKKGGKKSVGYNIYNLQRSPNSINKIKEDKNSRPKSRYLEELKKLKTPKTPKTYVLRSKRKK